MINLYATLGIDSHAEEDEIRLAISELRGADPELARDASGVLLDTDRRELYDLIHCQYQALALVVNKVVNKENTDRAQSGSELVQKRVTPSTDDNHWTQRLVEFS